MATLTFDRTVTPKVMTVALPDTVATIQEVYDQSRAFEATGTYELDDRPLVTAGGKDVLGGGNSTGVTLTLINGWRIAFAARGGPATIPCSIIGGNLVRQDPIAGTATTGDAGTVLIDSAASFLTDGIKFADVIENTPDGSSAVVVSVDSDIQITHSALSGGSENDWDIGEAYVVTASDPMTPTAFVYPTIAQSTAPLSIEDATTSFVDALKGTLFDGVTFEVLMEVIMAMANGRFVESPAGTFTFYKQDNATVIYTLAITATERTRS